MTPIDFSSLREKSKTINSQSDELTAALTAINAKLNSLNLGIETYCDSALETERETVLDNFNNEVEKELRVDKYLGYGKLQEKWGLLIKTEDAEMVDEGFGPDWVDRNTDYQFLLSSPRKLRIKAVDQVDDLVKKLEEEADELEAAVAKANTIAESL